MADRPLIGVTGPDGPYPFAWWATSFAIKMAGGRALRLTPSNYREHSKDKLRGLVIGGGNDIDPGLYGGHDSGLSMIDPERDGFEVEMIEHALHTHLPILGICRGAQLINVVLGGSLHSDIRPMRRLTPTRRTILPRTTAIGTNFGKLHSLIKIPRWKINSLHHQAIDQLGEGLQAVAYDLDNFVQGIESELHPFLLGVQWHPEYLQYIPGQRRLFRRIVEEAMSSRPEALYV